MFVLATQNEAPKTTDDLQAMGRLTERIGNADFCVATDGYFEVLGIPLIRGRIFDERDGGSAPHVAVISESLVRERWPNQTCSIVSPPLHLNLDRDPV
jgi:putative ABC transport system permease protein